MLSDKPGILQYSNTTERGFSILTYDLSGKLITFEGDFTGDILMWEYFLVKYNMPTVHTLRTMETVLALVGASLLIKGIEECSDKSCSNTETNHIVHEAAETIKHDADELKEFHFDSEKWVGKHCLSLCPQSNETNK